jgi:hypothetical protein
LRKHFPRVYLHSLLSGLAAHLPQSLPLLSSPLVLQISRLQPLQLLCYLIAVIRYLVRLAGLRPEIGNREFAVEIGAEVVHYTNGEENVHSKLQDLDQYNTSGVLREWEVVGVEGLEEMDGVWKRRE